MTTPLDSAQSEVGQLPDRARYAADRKRASSIEPDLLLVHPLLDASQVRRLLPAFWPEGEMAAASPGYHEVPSPLFDLRAFCRHDPGCTFPAPDADTLARARAWVDQLSERWHFGEVFGAGDVNFWAFLRDSLIHFVYEAMLQRQAFIEVMGRQPVVVLAAGLSDEQRMLLREFSREAGPRLRVVLAYAEPPAPPTRETVTERRVRKLFFLLQDAWHGIQFLFDDLFVRKPKVLMVSHSDCWHRRQVPGGRWARTDVHLESVWRAARSEPLRPYYRSDSYHPDVGAMTSGVLAPVHLRHFLFLLAQTSRGYRETRSILRKWRRLRKQEAFVESLVMEDLKLSDLLLAWFDEATRSALPKFVRDTRRESHFLRGIRPDAIVLTHEQDANLPLLVAARRMKIPTIALQTKPLQQWDDAYLSAPPDPSHAICLPDCLCVFASETKRRLVERGALEPSQVLVTGDPRLENLPADGAKDEGERARLRRLWGVEKDQRVLYLGCESQELPEVLGWLAAGRRQDRRIFLLLGLPGRLRGEEAAARQIACSQDLHWHHLLRQEALTDSMPGVDLVVTSDAHQVAETLLHQVPGAWIHRGPGDSALPRPVPAGLATVHDSASMSSLVTAVLAGEAVGNVSQDEREVFLDRTYGPRPGEASRRILNAVAVMLDRDGSGREQS